MLILLMTMIKKFSHEMNATKLLVRIAKEEKGLNIKMLMLQRRIEY